MIVMRRQKKQMLRVFLILGILAGSAILIYKLTIPKVISNEEILQEATLQPSINYEVHLIENDLYDENIQKEDSLYIKNIIDYIQISFNADYKTTKMSDINMDYELYGTMIGYNSDKENRTDYWSKKFPLSDQKKIHMEAEAIQKKEEIMFYFDEYDSFAKKANELTEINLSTELVIHMAGMIKATTTVGRLETPFDLQLTIPLNDNIVSITKGSLDPVKDQITQVNKVTQAPSRRLMVLSGIAAAVCLVFFILTFLLITEPSEWEQLRKESRKIIKNNGSRMVALRYRSDRKYNHYYEVNSIKDILIVSDETHNPIYYFIDDENEVEDNSFYVENNGDIYIYKQTIPHKGRKDGGLQKEMQNYNHEITV